MNVKLNEILRELVARADEEICAARMKEPTANAQEAFDELVSRIVFELRPQIIKAVPDTWLDPLLTGPNAVVKKPPFDCPDVERLCKAIRERLRTTLSVLPHDSKEKA